MKGTPRAAGFSLIELLAVLLIVAVLAAIALPAIGKARQSSGVEQSLANLVTLGVAHVLFAADRNGRQVTWAVDDLGFYDSVQDYCADHGGGYPPLVAGWGCNTDGNCLLYAYRPCSTPGHNWAVNPIGFPGGNGIDGFGNFRIPNLKAFHDYVNGRFYDPTFYAPNDTVPYELAAPFFESPWEFDPEGNPPIWVSYVLSPAAMYHPDVMRSNAAGGWQSPWDLDYGFQSPGLFQAQYPDLKTHMIEHNWGCRPHPPSATRLLPRSLVTANACLTSSTTALIRRRPHCSMTATCDCCPTPRSSTPTNRFSNKPAVWTACGIAAHRSAKTAITFRTATTGRS